MKLERYRRQIDLIDTQIIALLAAREDLSREIGKMKASAGLPVEDRVREADVLQSVAIQSDHSEAINEIYRAILQQSRRIQCSISEAKAKESVA
jgi:chorismate mutase